MIALSCRRGHFFSTDEASLDLDAELDGEILGIRDGVVFCPICGVSINLGERRTDEQTTSDDLGLGDIVERRGKGGAG